MHECENCRKYADCDSRCRMPVPCGSYAPKAQPPVKIHTYPEMNQKIKDILRLGDDPMCLYAAARIEELETLLAAAVKDIWNFSTGNTCRSCIHWAAGRCFRPGAKDCAGYSWWKWRGFADAEDSANET